MRVGGGGGGAARARRAAGAAGAAGCSGSTSSLSSLSGSSTTRVHPRRGRAGMAECGDDENTGRRRAVSFKFGNFEQSRWRPLSMDAQARGAPPEVPAAISVTLRVVAITRTGTCSVSSVSDVYSKDRYGLPGLPENCLEFPDPAVFNIQTHPDLGE